MANDAPTIAIEADPDDPDDFPVYAADLEVALAERRARTRGPQKAPTKRLVSLRLDPDLLDHFRSSGAGWQGRLNATLRRAVGL